MSLIYACVMFAIAFFSRVCTVNLEKYRYELALLESTFIHLKPNKLGVDDVWDIFSVYKMNQGKGYVKGVKFLKQVYAIPLGRG